MLLADGIRLIKAFKNLYWITLCVSIPETNFKQMSFIHIENFQSKMHKKDIKFNFVKYFLQYITFSHKTFQEIITICFLEFLGRIYYVIILNYILIRNFALCFSGLKYFINFLFTRTYKMRVQKLKFYFICKKILNHH